MQSDSMNAAAEAPGTGPGMWQVLGAGEIPPAGRLSSDAEVGITSALALLTVLQAVKHVTTAQPWGC